MGLIANVIPNAPIASAWGNAIRDRTVQSFASAAERDAQWTAPPSGAVCVTTDTYTLWLYAGTAWQPFGAAPKVYATSPLGGGAIAASELVVNTVTVPAQPRATTIELGVWHTYINDTSLDTFVIRLRAGSTVAGAQLAMTSIRINGGNMAVPFAIPFAAPVALAANTAATYCATMQRTAGTGTVSPIAGQGGVLRAIVYPT